MDKYFPLLVGSVKSILSIDELPIFSLDCSKVSSFAEFCSESSVGVRSQFKNSPFVARNIKAPTRIGVGDSTQSRLWISRRIGMTYYFRCGGLSHMVKDCHDLIRCFVCGVFGHKSVTFKQSNSVSLNPINKSSGVDENAQGNNEKELVDDVMVYKENEDLVAVNVDLVEVNDELMDKGSYNTDLIFHNKFEALQNLVEKGEGYKSWIDNNVNDMDKKTERVGREYL